MNERLQAFFTETWRARVFGDTFAGEDRHAAQAWAEAHLEDLAARTTRTTIAMIAPGIPEWNQQKIDYEASKSTFKTTVFGIALASGYIQNPDLLVPFGSAVNGMYWGNDQVDSGGPVADVTIDAINQLVGTTGVTLTGSADNHQVRARRRALEQISTHIRTFARPEDVPYVADCFYGQVLGNEVAVQLLSREYAAARDKATFLATHGAEFAERSTISAGFPSISSGLYSILRQQESVPPLSTVYGNEDMTKLLQVSNVFARLLDELGDWPKDGRGLNGDGPVPNTFVLNVFNQYHPSIVERYCELAFIPKDERAELHNAIADFHNDKPANGRRVIKALCAHIKRYYAELPPDIRTTFKEYIRAAKRVGEISLINVLGDEALRPKRQG